MALTKPIYSLFIQSIYPFSRLYNVECKAQHNIGAKQSKVQHRSSVYRDEFILYTIVCRIQGIISCFYLENLTHQAVDFQGYYIFDYVIYSLYSAWLLSMHILCWRYKLCTKLYLSLALITWRRATCTTVHNNTTQQNILYYTYLQQHHKPQYIAHALQHTSHPKLLQATLYSTHYATLHKTYY